MSESGFDPGLADPARAGVFFVTEDDLGPLSAVGHDAGLLARRIDLSGCDSKSALLLRIATVLDFPQTSGRNWDALSDSLRDLSWLEASGYVLLFEQAHELRDRTEADFDTLLDILDEASQSWAADEVPFWAFIALPDEDFPDLQ
ncbi:MAG: barnase inhibitor [Xanthomonas sp.]|nr:barnase inhibitor [Xanthomonas sp.]